MKHRFQYHAFATGFAGQITQPFEYLIEAQAPSALSPAGGYSSNRVENYRLKEILSFRAAYTQTAGAFVDKSGRQSWDTVVTSTVENLNIMGIVTADLIVARLASRHGVHDPEPSILPLGSRIEGLRIAGIPIEVDWDYGRYSHNDTYEKACPPDTPDRATKPAIATSIVGKIAVTGSFLETNKHVIHVPQFGTVVLGQLLIDGNARQITMLQVYPECAVAVACTAGSGQTNGKPVPPIPPIPPEPL
jgi:hypothetical protein